MTTRTVRSFISSSFRNMHAKRDLLVRKVFAELPEYDLKLIQFWRLPGVDRVDNLYRVAANKLHLHACDDLVTVKGVSCAIDTVHAVGCPSVTDIEIHNIGDERPDVRFTLCD